MTMAQPKYTWIAALFVKPIDILEVGLFKIQAHHIQIVYQIAIKTQLLSWLLRLLH